MNYAYAVGGFVVVALLALLFLGGCASTSQHAAINQAALSDRAAVQAADQMLTARKISVTDAKAVYDSSVAVRKSLGAWEDAVIAASNSVLPKGGAVKSTSAAASLDLQALLVALNRLPATDQGGRRFLAPLHPVSIPAMSGAKKLTPAAVVAIIQLAADLTPVITNWINTAFNKTPVGPDDVAATFKAFDADLSKLRADITAAGG